MTVSNDRRQTMRVTLPRPALIVSQRVMTLIEQRARERLGNYAIAATVRPERAGVTPGGIEWRSAS